MLGKFPPPVVDCCQMHGALDGISVMDAKARLGKGCWMLQPDCVSQ